MSTDLIPSTEIDKDCEWDAQMKATILKGLNDKAISEWTRKIMDVLIPHLNELYKENNDILKLFTDFVETQTEDAFKKIIAACPNGEIKKQLEQIELKKVLPDVDPWSYCDKKHSPQ